MWALLVGLARADEPPPPPPGMAGHFQAVTLAMLSVAVDDIDAAREQGQVIAKDKMAPTPLRAPAKALAKARTLEKAAPAVADLGRACAECHTAGRRGPNPHDTDQLPPGSPTDQHIAAATFIWIGLVTPHQRTYEVGLRYIVPPVDLDDDEALLQSADLFRESAEEALETPAWDERAELFGRMLLKCADCHAHAGVRP